MPPTIWDGNGGTLDPRTASQHDLLVALHVKMDNIVVPSLHDHENRIRTTEARISRALGGLAALVFIVGILGTLANIR